MRPFMLYDRHSGEGILFDEDRHGTKEQVGRANSNLVDSPAKAGVNPWGPESEALVQKTKADFEAGRLPAIDPPGGIRQFDLDREAELAMLRAERDEAIRQRDENLRQKETAAEEKRRVDEWAVEERFEGARDALADGKGMTGGLPVALPEGEGDQLPNAQEYTNREAGQALSVADAIRLLPPRTMEPNDPNWTGPGVPRVPALESLLGRKVTGEERDAAWAEVQGG